MEEVIIKIIAEIQDNKRKNKVGPEHVLLQIELLGAIRKEALATLDKLVADGRVKRCNTINDIAYSVCKR